MAEVLEATSFVACSYFLRKNTLFWKTIPNGLRTICERATNMLRTKPPLFTSYLSKRFNPIQTMSKDVNTFHTLSNPFKPFHLFSNSCFPTQSTAMGFRGIQFFSNTSNSVHYDFYNCFIAIFDLLIKCAL